MQQQTPATSSVGRIAHRMMVTINPTAWSYHFTDDPTGSYWAAERINEELVPIGVELTAILPTLEETDDSDKPHRYTAHDSGLMAFAVETDMMGAVHAVDATGKELAVVHAPDGFDGEDLAQVRQLTHQLIDAMFDAEAAQDPDEVPGVPA